MKKLFLTCAILLLMLSGSIQTREIFDRDEDNTKPENDEGTGGNDQGGNDKGGNDKGGNDKGGNDEIDKDICDRIQSLNLFKAKSILHYEGREYHIEEIQLETRGRLKVTFNQKVSDIFFEKKDGKLNIAYYEQETNTCEVQKGVTKSPHDHLHPYRFFNSQSSIFGPTGLWSKVVDIVNGTLELKEDPENPTNERGIASHRCETKGFELFDLGETTAKLTVSDPKWTIFDQAGNKVPEPLSLNVAGQTPLPKAPVTVGPFDITIEYLSFETIDPSDQQNLQLHEFDFNEDYWITPSICESFGEEQASIQIPSRMKMSVENLDELAAGAVKSKEDTTDGDDQNEKKSNGRTKILIDKQDDFKGFIDEDLDKVQIYQGKHKLLFEINRGLFCKSYYQKEAKMDSELFDLFDELSSSTEKYRNVGIQMIRNIRTNVYRKREEFEGKKVVKVTTLYLQEAKSEANPDQFTHDPVQIRFEEFKMEEGNYERVGSLLYTFFDFESFKSDDELVKTLDLTECIEPSNAVSLSIVAKRGEKKPEEPKEPAEGDDDDKDKPSEIQAEKINKQDDDSDRKDEENELKKTVKEELRKMLVKASEQTVIAFPKFHVDTYPKEVIAHFTFIDIVSPFAYFVKPEKETRNKNEPDNLVEAQTEMQCASKALKDQTCVGYEFCKGGENPAPYCDLLNDKMLGSNKTDSTNCVIREKVDIAKEKEFSYQTTNEKIDVIRAAANEKKLTLETHQGEYLPFEQLHRVAEESEIDRSKLFSRTRKHHKISDKKSKQLNLEDGITTLASCFEACVDPKNDFTCDSFSFCRRFDVLFDCNIAELNRKNADDDFSEYFEADEACHVFTVSALEHFQPHEGNKLNDETPLRTFASSNSAECAQDCLNYNQENDGKERCLSIEVCETGEKGGHCRLSGKQSLWKGSDDQDVLIEDENCNVHSVKHLLNFHATTKEKLQNFLKETVDSIDQCATVCDLGECKQFNYCEREDRKECRYVSEIASGDKHNTERESDEIGCTSYIHRDDFIVKPPETVKEDQIENRFSGKGFRRGSVTGLVFLFLFIGMFVGAAGLYAKKRYLNGGGTDGGENATITFSNLNRENDD